MLLMFVLLSTWRHYLISSFYSILFSDLSMFFRCRVCHFFRWGSGVQSSICWGEKWRWSCPQRWPKLRSITLRKGFTSIFPYLYFYKHNLFLLFFIYNIKTRLIDSYFLSYYVYYRKELIGLRNSCESRFYF